MMSSSSTNWVDAITQLDEHRHDYVLITLLGSHGSTPRSNGTKMVVSAIETFGTIGGGHLEFKAMEIAAELLSKTENQQRIEYFPLGPGLGQCCGGTTTVLFESFKACDFNIMLFGAGHVGAALTGILQQLPCKISWVDNREALHPQTLPGNINPILSEQPADEVADMPAGSYFLIMTHNHQLDFEILEAVLKRGDAKYVGLIGSDTKWRRFKMRMEHKGHCKEFYEQVHCPVGLEAVPGKRPIEVAVSVAGELIAINNSVEREKPDHKGVSLREAKQVMRELATATDCQENSNA
ncbi:MAG: xanthine dehydrogenase accessory protein XdhC [Halioglobus sp.]